MGKRVSDVITLTFEVIVHGGDVGHRTASVYQIWSLYSCLYSEDMLDFQSRR